MFSITPSEFLTIAVIALIVFGPRRLAEMARRAGKITADLKRTSDELRAGIQEELDGVSAPFREAATGLAAAGKGLLETAEGELKWVDVGPADAEPEADAGGVSEAGTAPDPPAADGNEDGTP